MKCFKMVQVGGYQWVGKDEQSLQAAVAKSPVVVGVDSKGWFQYKSGVFQDCASAGGTNTDHAVLVTGYGTSDYWGDYWTIKNSWGSDWAKQGGYIFLPRNKGSQCNIASWPLIPTPP